MIDLHCHLLPGVDDGPRTLQESLQLAECAVENGITHTVATPHIQPDRYGNSRNNLEPGCHRLMQALQEHSIPLKLALAAEVRICPEIMALLDDDEVPLLGNKKNQIILLELPHSHIPPGTDKMLIWLLSQHIQPLIAHPERNREIMNEPDKLAPFIHLGCLLQLTAGSIAGHFGEKVRRASEIMLKNGWVNVIASDAHNLTSRKPELMSGVKAAEAVIGSIAAKSMVTANAEQIAGSLFMTESHSD